VARSASYSHKVPAMAVLAACSRTLTIRAARSSNVRPVGVQQEAGQRGLLHWPIVVHAGAGVSSDAGAQLPWPVGGTRRRVEGCGLVGRDLVVVAAQVLHERMARGD